MSEQEPLKTNHAEPLKTNHVLLVPFLCEIHFLFETATIFSTVVTKWTKCSLVSLTRHF